MTKNRSHLVPTPVVNKNGTLTIVHKKPSSAPPSAAVIPPASLPQRTASAAKLSGLQALAAASSRTAHDIHWMFTHNKKKVGKRVQDAMVAEIHQDTFAVLDMQGPRPHAGVVSQVFHSSVMSKSFIPLNNLAVVSEVMHECDEQHFMVFSTYVAGLQMYRQHSDPLTDWSSKSAAEQEIPKALIRAAMGLKKPYAQTNAWVEGNPRHIVSEELTELVMKRPQDVQRIIALVNERDLPVDTEQGIGTLEGLLDQETENPLISGLL